MKVFFGYAAGVGKTYAMLQNAREQVIAGIDVVVGYIEPHTRPETLNLLNGLEVLEKKKIKYKEINLKEFDLDLALKRKPEIILVDELAHTNAPGSRHIKRWQDIEELLLNGIDVYTTINVQHLESLNDVVANITSIFVRETVPDKILENASQVKIIDIEPEDLLKRFNDGKVYNKKQVKQAKMNFFKKENLDALRELALRKIAQRANREVQISRLSKSEIEICPTSELLLACVSMSPSSSKVLRTASRMAQSLMTKWIAVYVEDDFMCDYTVEQKNQLKNNLDLAKDLGAEIVILHGTDLVKEILNFAKLQNVTKIVIGRNHSRKNKIFNLYYKRDIVDKIMDLSDVIEIHVIPSINLKVKKTKKTFNITISNYFQIGLKDVIIAIFIIVLATFISILSVKAGFSKDNVLLFYILGILFISINTKGYIIGIIASLINAFLFNYLFTNPMLTFSMQDPKYLTTVPLFTLVAIITSTLTTKIKEEANLSAKKEKNTQMLYQMSRSFLQIVGRKNIVSQGLEHINNSIKRTVVFYFTNIDGSIEEMHYKLEFDDDMSLINDEDEKAVAVWVARNDKAAGAGTDTLPGAKLYYIPVMGYNRNAGVIGIDCSENNIDNDEQILIDTIIAQMSLALDREVLYREQEKSKIDIERERLRNDLLRAISHDLRTPLTGIVGASSLIIQSIDKLDNNSILKFVEGIQEDGEWLIRLVENLLSMTRIDEGKLELKKENEIVDEIIYEAINHVKKRTGNHEIKVELPNEVLLVPMDGKLIEQVLVNLIDNALKYTPQQSIIKVSAYKENKFIVFDIVDNGYGIKDDLAEQLFERFFTSGNTCVDSRKGVGLGLAICKSIINAHGGEIKARNNKTKGATFQFKIPLN